jgi:hypothetical protein
VARVSADRTPSDLAVPRRGAECDLLIGAAEGDDAAVLRLDDARALALTTDFFTRSRTTLGLRPDRGRQY